MKFLLLAEAFAVATFGVGWWGVVFVAVVCGLAMSPSARPAGFAAISAGAGWLFLLLLDAAKGPVGQVATNLGGVMSVSPVVLLALTLVFPALVAWSAASVAAVLRDFILRRRGVSNTAVSTPAEPTSNAGEVAMADA